MNTKHGFPNKGNDGNPLKRKPLRQAGQSDADMVRSLEFEIALYLGIGLFVGLFAIYIWLTWIARVPPNPWVWTVIALIVIPLCYLRIRRLVAKRNNYDLGRQGEIEVGNFLEELRKEGYDIFHDVQCDREGRKFNIDHVIVSPHGIFAVETKAPRKRLVGNNRVYFDGQSTIKISGRASDRETVPNAISKASFLANNILPKGRNPKRDHVISILAYPGWSVIGNHLGKDTWVLNPGQLKAVISQQPLSLTHEQCDSVSQFLKERNR